MRTTLYSDILYTIIYVVLLAWVLRVHQRRTNGQWGSGSIILLSYIIYPFIGAFWLFSPTIIYGDIVPLKLFPFLYLALMLYVATIPALKYDTLHITSIESPTMAIVHIFTFIYIACTILQIPHMISHISEGLTAIMLDSSSGADIYGETLSRNRDNAFNGGSISNLHIIIYNIFAQVALLLFFYYLTIEKKHKWAIVGLGLCIIVRCLSSIANGQRTDVTMTIFDIIVAYGATKQMFSKTLQERIKNVLLIIGAMIAIPFMALSFSRFGDQEGGLTNGLVYYIGEAPYYFNMYAMDAGGTRNGDRTCNIFKKFIGLNSPDGEFAVRDQYPNMKMNDSIFSTFVGDFVLDFGVLGTAIIFFVFSLIFSLNARCNAPNQIPLHRLLLIYFAMTVCMRGGMYLYAYSFRGNLNIIAILLFYGILAADYHLRHRNIYYQS